MKSFWLVCLIVSSCTVSTEIPDSEKTADDLVLSEDQMKMAGVKTGGLTKMKIGEYIECTGVVDVPPYSLASVYSHVTGIIQKSSLLEGDYVQKGAILTTIKHPDLVRLQREFLETGFNLKKLMLAFERQETLWTNQAGSSREYEEAKAAYEIEKAHFNGLKAELQLVGIDVSSLEKNSEIQESIHIYAPISGYISRAAINLGKLITPQDLLYEIIDRKHVHLELKIFAGDLSKIEKNQEFVATMPGTNLVYSGHVYLIGKVIDPIQKTARLHGHFEDEPVALAPGTFLNAKIKINQREGFALPEDAFVREGSKMFSFIYNNQSFEKIEMKTGPTENGWVFIETNNLDTTATFVTSGAYYIENNSENDH
jgi:membrane fusion protein, heavy metal efflux system